MSQLLDDMHVDETLVVRHLHATSDQDVLAQLANVMLQEGIVKESYIPAIQAREVAYSTGLQCVDMGVAIPHTDSEHVNVQAIAIAILDEPVQFAQMGTPEIKVDVKITFMLAIKEPHKQMQFLQALMSVFSEEGKLPQLLNLDSNQNVVDTFTSFFVEDITQENIT